MPAAIGDNSFDIKILQQCFYNVYLVEKLIP
jgi:hypothetical protein